MPDSIAFYFDFSSPYGYLASTQIEDLAARHGRTVDWRPILLGVVYPELRAVETLAAQAAGRGPLLQGELGTVGPLAAGRSPLTVHRAPLLTVHRSPLTRS